MPLLLAVILIAGCWMSLYAAETTDRGVGIFTSLAIESGVRIIKFTGELVHRNDMKAYEKFIQVDTHIWMGSSGLFDDFINHSCNPNTGIVETGNKYEFWLETIRPIAAFEEITFDYSTSMVYEPTDMACNCKSENCRGIINNFADLPLNTQNKYINLKIIPKFVLEASKELIGTF